ncbi:hypothetical protein MTP99_005023 [Tenebrio molitor]|jgi:hypothetical protein|nr:hypothetical protein MTP99_005023 [Tenebrio molitor]
MYKFYKKAQQSKLKVAERPKCTEDGDKAEPKLDEETKSTLKVSARAISLSGRTKTRYDPFVKMSSKFGGGSVTFNLLEARLETLDLVIVTEFGAL